MSAESPTGGIDLELGRRLHRALTASAEELFQVIQDPAATVLRAVLKNPQLGEEHLIALLNRRDLPEDLLKAVYQLGRTESSHRLKLALAKNPGTPGPIILALLPHLHLFELLDLCILPGNTPDQRYAAERQIVQRLPVTPLGNKLTLARRGPATLLAELLREGDSRIVEASLSSPRLKEVALLQFLTGPRADAETISMIARHPKWKTRPNLRLAILKNRKTPSVWFTLFLPQLGRAELRSLLASRRLAAPQRQLVESELKRRGG